MDLFDAKSAALLTALQRHGVAYLLVGGYAVNLHGYSRGTGDMDIWIRPTAENVLRLVAAFEACGYDVGGLAAYAPQVPTQGLSLRVTDEPFILDVMTQLSGPTFDEAYAQHRTYDLDGLEIHLIHRNDLVMNKLTTGRAKDLADVQSLQYIEAYWKGQKLEVFERPTPQRPPLPPNAPSPDPAASA